MKCAFIFNPHSGKCKQGKMQDYIVNQLKKKYEVVDVFPTQYATHAIELARNTCGKYDLLVAAGGDGTLNEVVNGIAGQENSPILGYIPQGTVNDVGHSLRISTNIKKAVKNILTGVEYSHDIFKVNDRYGFYVCCAGLFTETSYATDQKVKKSMGKVAYALHGVKKIFSTQSMDLKLTFDGGEIKDRFAFMLILNSRNVASFGINKKASLNDGLIDVLLVKEKKSKVSLRGIAKVCSVFMFGINRLKKSGLRLRLPKFTVEISDSTVINVDGEKAGQGKFELNVIKQGVRIIVPEKFFK